MLVAGGGSVAQPTQRNPEMDGRHIVYEYQPIVEVAPNDSDIKVYDVGTGVTTPVTDGAGDDDFNQSLPDVWSDLVVYQSDQTPPSNIYLYNVSWYNTVRLTNSGWAQTGPRVSGGFVIWHDAASNGLVWHAMTEPQYTNHPIDGSAFVALGTWDIDGDTVVFAKETAPGDFDFYRWTVGSSDAPHHFGTHDNASDVNDVRLHNSRIVYTYGAAQDHVGVMSIHDGDGGELTAAGRDGDVFHEMYGYENTVGGDLTFIHNETWSTTIGGVAPVETDPSVFGNRMTFERNVNNGDILLDTSSEPLIDRTAGSDRYATAVEASKEYFRMGANSVVLCTGENFPDALSAAPWARFMRAPLLLTRRTYVPDVVIDEIDRLGASTVWIVGGEAAVASSVETQLEAEGLTVDRQLQGADRYATSKQIAYFLYDALIADGRSFSNMAFIARGDSFPDALAVAPVAAATYSPILLVKTNAPLPAPTANVLEFLPIKEAFIVGGTSVVSVPVEEAIEVWTTFHNGASAPATRMSGADRYATSASVLGNALSMNWVDLDAVGLATGLNFPDALGGGAALGSYGSPLLLTKPASLPASVDDVLEQHAAEIGRVDIFGGTSVVSDGVRLSVRGILVDAVDD